MEGQGPNMESIIDSLPPPEYTQKPREVINFAGETAGLVLMNPNDPEDMRRVRDIERKAIDVNPIFNRGKDTDAKLMQWVGREWTKNQAWDENGFWASSGYPTAPIGIVGLNEVGQADRGEVIGWTNFYPTDNQHLLANKKEGGFLVDNEYPIIEVSYAKDPDAPPGHMASGLRQTALYILRGLTPLEKEGESPAEFEARMSRPPDLQIVAEVLAENEASVRVLEASGFVKRGEAVHSSTQKPISLYKLDWAKLHQIVQDKSLADLKLNGIAPQEAVNTTLPQAV